MSHWQTLKQLVVSQQVDSVLKRGSSDSTSVRALQKALNELGFATLLGWEMDGADGRYGDRTAAAVKAFAQKNGLSGDGETVSFEIASRILDRAQTIDALRHLYSDIVNDRVEQRYCISSGYPTAVQSLQTLLYHSGFGAQLDWQRFGADGKYGANTAAAVKSFAASQQMACAEKHLTRELAQRLIDNFSFFYGPDWTHVSAPHRIHSADLLLEQATEGGKVRIYVSDGRLRVRFTKLGDGLYTSGHCRPLDFIRSHPAELGDLGLSEAQIHVMASVSENQSNFDALNTWGKAIFALGMFQWSAGVDAQPGELPALLQRIKRADADLFARHFGRHGLDIDAATDKRTGFFTLGGQRLDTLPLKSKLRTPEWAFCFWRAAQAPQVQALQVVHACQRLHRFYGSGAATVKGHPIKRLITSQYGVALLLDNHVDRPAYLTACLAEAMHETGLADPENWDSAEELRLLDAYLEIRRTYGKHPMTDAARRAAVTRNHVARGLLSDTRGSFDLNVA